MLRRIRRYRGWRVSPFRIAANPVCPAVFFRGGFDRSAFCARRLLSRLRDFEEFLFRARKPARKRTLPASPPQRDRMTPKCGSASRQYGRIHVETQIRRQTSDPHSFRFLEIIYRADFYRSFTALAPRWNSLAPLDCFVQVFAFENVITGKLFLGFGKWPVDRH